MDLQKHAPSFEIRAAVDIARESYGMAVDATPLASERDQNFLLATPSNQRFVLKIANELEDRCLLEAQNAVLLHLSNRVNLCPAVVPTVRGEAITKFPRHAIKCNFVRLLTYIPGVPLAERHSVSSALLQNLGRALAEIDSALAGFDHPAIHREFHWDLANAPETIARYKSLIEDTELQKLVDICLQRYERNVQPLLPQLGRSVIHNDANDYNVLTSDDGDSVLGIIDFGDMVWSFTVGDLAVALAYVLLDSVDPLATAAELVSGYQRVYSLNNSEIAALYDLSLARLALSVCIAAQQTRQRPDNAYLKISQRPIEVNLPRLVQIDAEMAAEVFLAKSRM
ncbi:MAG: phosphotransferase [Pyrinomonadaceae bacterium]